MVPAQAYKDQDQRNGTSLGAGYRVDRLVEILRLQGKRVVQIVPA